jgi:hypothetical protein
MGNLGAISVCLLEQLRLSLLEWTFVGLLSHTTNVNQTLYGISHTLSRKEEQY